VNSYVVYHNVEAMGHDCLGPGYSIVTRKNIPKVIGNRIWLIRGKGKPRRYHLVETFVVQRFCASRDHGRFLYYAESDEGRKGQKKFGLTLEIGNEDWFYALSRAAGNFGLGLQGVKSQIAINGLRKVSGIRD
jgi:hypothetical protein